MKQIKVNYTYEIILYLLKKMAHGREIANELKTSLTRVQLVLSELRDYNILDYKVEGKNHIYFIKKNLVSKAYVLNAENYKLAKLLRKYAFLEPLFKDIVEKYPNILIMLFGSYAKFVPKEDSDIDVYVHTSDEKVKEVIKGFHDNLSIKIGEFNKKDLLVQEIIRDHIIIQGGEIYYGKLEFFK